MTTLFPIILALLAGCSSDEGAPSDSASDTGPTGPVPADLAPLSSGECPDLSASGDVAFLSSGEERQVSVRIPKDLQPGAPLVLFFHGFDMPKYDEDPGALTADGLDIQDLADETGAVFLLPESRVFDMYGLTFFMWMVWEDDEVDLALYDDLRTCAVNELGVDPYQVHAMGFSGGALFVTTLYRERNDTLASALEMSGGADIDLGDMFDNPLSRYATPTVPVPVLLYSGGKDDAWPEGFSLVNFLEATDAFQADLLADDLFLVRCRHEQGHTVTNSEWNIAQEWPFQHVFGQPSPYGADLGDWTDKCEIPEQKP